MNPQLSIIVPVFNEEAVLPLLFARLYPALDQLGRAYEILFVDDGSRDRSVALLREQLDRRPDSTRLVLLAQNAGQHMAILAGFELARGSLVVTLDADLQDPPEEIGKLVALFEQGYDYIGGVRAVRRDAWWRDFASRLLNVVRERTTRIHMTDQGCMLRGYARNIVDAVNRCGEVSTFVPALAYAFARNPTEVSVQHEPRAAGASKYSLFRLVRLNFDLMTGFSLVPLQIFTMSGLLIAVGSLGFVAYLALRRIFIGPEAEGVFTLFGILFFLVGVLLLGLGIVGEYVGRIYLQVRQRPRYVIAAVLEHAPDTSARMRQGQDAMRGQRG